MTQAPSPTENLILRAADVAHAAPREWAGFLAELRAYVDFRNRECVQAPLAMLQVAQGRAQSTSQMLDLLEKAVTTATAISAARHQK